jgi:anhydro-N-acetylmuramic acid kinase
MGDHLMKLHFDYGAFLGQKALHFIEKSNEKIDFIASHGHTIYHQIENGFTFQLGHGASISINSRHKVVCDFRSSDVALGGQGAPLVPLGDIQLFPEFSCCINMGGISNFSFKKNEKVLAYDIVPCNMVLNHLMEVHFDKQFDKDGQQSQNGKINQSLLSQLNELSYYKKPSPKSLGKEWVFKTIIPLLKNSKVSINDQLATYSKHVVDQIKSSIKLEKIEGKILMSGGGSKNKYLTSLLLKENINIELPSTEIIDFKEALIFGFLGLKRVREEINIYDSVTAASKNSISGCIYLP